MFIFVYINIVYVHFCANFAVVIVPGGVIIVAMTILCRVMLESIDGLYLFVNTALDFPVG